MNYCKFIYIGIGFLLLNAWGYAQTDSLRVLKGMTARQNNFTISTRQYLRYERNFNRIKINAFQQQENLYNQSLTRSKWVQASWQHQLWLQYPLLPKFSLTHWFDADVFLTSHNQKWQGYMGITWNPIPQMEITPLAGYSIDERNGRQDKGFSPAVFYKWNANAGNNWLPVIQGYSRRKYITPRIQDNHQALITWAPVQSQSVNWYLQQMIAYHELDDYSGNTIQRILSDTFKTSSGLQYLIAKSVGIDLLQEVTFQRRQFKYKSLDLNAPNQNTVIFSQPEIKSQISGYLQTNKLQIRVGYAYELVRRFYKINNNQQLPEISFAELVANEKEKEYYAGFQKVFLSFWLKVFPRHTLEGESSAQYLQYDTPSKINIDDRDELTRIIRLNWMSKWTRKFRMQYEWTGQYRYFGFLSNIKSQDNYEQYQLKLKSSAEWDFAPQWRLILEQSVNSLYNVKTFEDTQFTDRSTRNLESKLNLTKIWSPAFRSEFKIERKVLRISWLNWDQFSESPLDSTWFHTLESTHEWRWGKNKAWTGKIGYRFFRQVRHQLAILSEDFSVIQWRQINQQIGPLTGLSFRTLEGSWVFMMAWWQVQQFDNRYQRITGRATLNQPKSLSEVDNSSRSFVPYFEIGIRFVL